MTRSVPEATIAVGRIRMMPFGRARAEAAARQVRTIEAEGPDPVLAYALESLVEALTWTGEPEKALVPFVKLLHWWDTHPEHFDAGDQNILFWEFGWIVNDMCHNPMFSEAKVEQVLQDMERRFLLANRGLERVWSSRLIWELMRRGPDLEKTFTTWLTMPVDDEDYCPACHQEHHADYLVETGDLAGAVAVIEAALNSQLSCTREPASMLALLAWCYLELGKLDELEQMLSHAVAEVQNSTASSVLVAFARLFEVYARGGDAKYATGLLNRIVDGTKLASRYVRLESLRHLLSGARCLVDQGFGSYELSVTGLEPTNVAELTAWVETEAQTLTEAFDTRHSSTVQADRLARFKVARPTTRRLATTLSEPASDEPVEQPTVVPHHSGYLQAIQDRAEAAFKAGDHDGAARLYRQAAKQAQTDGQLGLAGWFWAEAARNCQEIQQWDSVSRDYVEAHAHLRAAGVSLEEITPLLVAWAPGVQQSDYRTFLSLAMQDYPTSARCEDIEPIEEIVSKYFEASMINTPLLRRYILARAELNDTIARVMATWGDPAEKQSALEMAQESASRFSVLGRVDDAAHAWWLAGKVAASMDAKTTKANFTLAVIGFSSTGERNLDYRNQAVADYTDYLNQTGQNSVADQVLARWVTKEN